MHDDDLVEIVAWLRKHALARGFTAADVRRAGELAARELEQLRKDEPPAGWGTGWGPPPPRRG